MEDKNLSDLGRQMSDIVQDAVRTKDFSRLKKTVEGAVNESVGTFFSPTYKAKRNRPPFTSNTTQRQEAPPPVRYMTAYKGPYLKKASLKMAGGIVMIVFGALLGLSVITTTIFIQIARLIGSVFFPSSSTYQFAFSGVLLIGSAFLLLKGSATCGRISRYKKYWRLFGERNFCTVKTLADGVQKPQKFVKKELRKLLRNNMFPEAHMDQQETCLMLGEETYLQYQSTQENLERRRLEEEEKKNNPNASISIIAEGRNYIQQIHEVNDALPGTDISTKLYRLEDVTTEIFSYVEQHPHKLPEIRRFMEYYLPTTIKLVASYGELEAQAIKGETVTLAKQEILEILDTINIAFEKLLDNLFCDDAMDISSDISALKTILTQEGLTEKDFKTP